ncbi:MAG: sensor histidine kinase [bacterium]|nr:sensor histidine kinase [bacterium]
MQKIVSRVTRIQNYLKQKFHALTLFQKIFIILFFLVLWLNFFFFVSLQVAMQRYDETLYESTASRLSYITDSLERELSEISALSDSLIIHSEIQSNLEHLKEHPNDARAAGFRRDIYNSFFSYFNSTPYLLSLAVETDDSFICMGADIPTSVFDREEIRQQAREAQGRLLWIPGKEKPLLLCAREIRRLSFLKLDELGTLYLVLDLEQMVQDTLRQFSESPTHPTFMLLGKTGVFYQSGDFETELDSLLSTVMPLFQEQPYGYRILSLEHRKQFVAYGSFSSMDWKYLYLQDYNLLFQSIQLLRRVLTLSILLSACFALIGTHWLLKNTFRHMDYLIEKIRLFGQGLTLPPKNRYDYSKRQDEIGQLHRSFDEMTHNVKQLRDENYEKQLLLRDAQIRILEQQINPHFLYNTLDTINWMAQAYHAEDISLMVRALGNLFRASIAVDRDLIPLSKELDFLNNYIQIQKIRFKERLDIQISLPENISSIEVPKLCIQPLVENAMKYAMECSDETCLIRVSITEEEDCYSIQIANTGSSFEENLLEKLEHKTVKTQGTGVGLMNINSRLQLLYGEAYGLHVKNENGMAIVLLSIPKQVFLSADAESKRPPYTSGQTPPS